MSFNDIFKSYNPKDKMLFLDRIIYSSVKAFSPIKKLQFIYVRFLRRTLMNAYF